MPTGINIQKRVIDTVSIPIQTLGISKIRNNGIRRNEHPHHGIIESGVVVVEPGFRIEFLARIELGAFFQPLKGFFLLERLLCQRSNDINTLLEE